MHKDCASGTKKTVNLLKKEKVIFERIFAGYKNSCRIVSRGKSELIVLSYTYLTVKHCIFNFALYEGMDEVPETCLLLRASEDLNVALVLKKGLKLFPNLTL